MVRGKVRMFGATFDFSHCFFSNENFKGLCGKVWFGGKVRMFGGDIRPAADPTLRQKRDFHLNLGQLQFEGKFHSMVD